MRGEIIFGSLCFSHLPLRGRDHLYFQENARSSTKTGTSEAKELLNTAPLAPAVTFATGSKRTDKHVLSSKSQSTKNLISGKLLT